MSLQTRLADLITAIGADIKSLRTRVSTVETDKLSSVSTVTQPVRSHLQFADNKKLILRSNTPAGGITRLLEFHMTTEFDRPWISWFDENELHRASFGYHSTDVVEGGSHQAVELKTVAADGVDLRTRMSIGTHEDRTLVGFASIDMLEVFQGDNVPNVQFGFQLRAKPLATDVGVPNAIIGVFTAQLDGTDQAFGNIDIKPPYLGGSAQVPGNKTATLNFFRNTNSVSSSSPQIAIKKGDGTNTNSFILNAKQATFQAMAGIAAFGAAPPTVKPVVTGKRGADTVASLLTALAAAGFITDSTTAPGISTTLPVAPVDGQEIYFQTANMAADGVIWHLRYNAADPSIYKWQFLGGASLFRFGTKQSWNDRSTPNGTQNQYLDPTAPQIRVPLAGTYQVDGSVIGVTSNTTSAPGFMFGKTTSTDINWPAGDSIDSVAAGTQNTFGLSAVSQVDYAANDLAAMWYTNANIGGAVSFYNARMALRPVRVG